MPWFRLDDSFDSHPKVIAAGNEAVGLYVRCGTYCARHLTDGYIPEHIALLYGSPALAETLVRTKLWRRARGGWRMRDYLDYNPSAQTVDNERAAKTERQRRWREARGRRPVDASTGASRDGSVDAAPTPSPPRPEGSGAGNAPRSAANGRASPPGSPARGGKPKPPWCGECDEVTRQTGDPPARCPVCHPLADASGRKDSP
jgi:hypothetical protein